MTKKTINTNPFKSQERQDSQDQVVDQLKCLEQDQEKDLDAEKEECDLYFILAPKSISKFNIFFYHIHYI